MIAKGDGDHFAAAVQKEIANRLTEHQFLTWFQRVGFEVTGPDRVSVSVPNRFFMTYLKQRYLPVIAESIESVTSVAHPRIEFEIGDAVGGADHLTADHPTADRLTTDRPTADGGYSAKVPAESWRGGSTSSSVRSGGIPATPHDSTSHDPGSHATPRSAESEPYMENLVLNPDYTLDQFVVGPANRLPHAAAVAIANAPGTAYNPLYVYGSVGLGKTHLMQAVAQMYLANGLRKVVYTSSTSFADDFIHSISNNTLDKFRQKYREADALLIDDVQCLGEMERTREEFFHTFNLLHSRQRQIFLSADRLPSEIEGLGDRLVSRFKLGLVTQLTAPSFETRVAILQQKSTALGFDLPGEIAEFVASRIRDNVRELEGAVYRLLSMVEIENRDLSTDEVRHALADVLGHDERRLDLNMIQRKVLEEFDVLPSDLHSRSRTRSVVIPRQICMYLGREHTSLSLGEIGLFFGGRDHSTVLHAIDKIRRMIREDSRIRAAVASIERQLGV